MTIDNGDIKDIQDPPHTVKPKRKIQSKNPDKRSHGHRYSLTQRIAVKALAESGVSPTAIARTENIDRSTVYSIMKNRKIEVLAQHQVNAIKRSLIGLAYANAYRAQEKITENKLDAMNAYQLSLISSINVDKARLGENLSTENISHRGLNETLAEDRQRILDKISGLGGGEIV